MNADELQSLIVSSYEQDAQTLTTDNEANVLKFKEIMGILTPDEKERWDSIKYAFVESVRMQGMDSEDQAGQLMRQLASMRDGLESIRAVISRAIAVGGDGKEERMDERIDSLRHSLTASAEQLSETLKATGTQLERISEHQATSQPPDQRVFVQHKVPRVLADLIKGQFHLMQEWLRPILTESIDNGRDLERLKNQLDAMQENYRRDRVDIRCGHRRRHDEPEPARRVVSHGALRRSSLTRRSQNRRAFGYGHSLLEGTSWLRTRVGWGHGLPWGHRTRTSLTTAATVKLSLIPLQSTLRR